MGAASSQRSGEIKRTAGTTCKKHLSVWLLKQIQTEIQFQLCLKNINFSRGAVLPYAKY